MEKTESNLCRIDKSLPFIHTTRLYGSLGYCRETELLAQLQSPQQWVGANDHGVHIRALCTFKLGSIFSIHWEKMTRKTIKLAKKDVPDIRIDIIIEWR